MRQIKNSMAQQNGNLQQVISPSDGNASGNDEFSHFLLTNQVTQVNEIDESSNSSTAHYTELVSITNRGKYYQINISITYIISN